MRNKILAIVGIVVYILSVITSAEDSAGNYTAPELFIATSGIITIAFFIIATIRLWKIRKMDSLLFLGTCIVKFVNTPNFIKIISLIVYFWSMWVLWSTRKDNKVAEELNNFLNMTPEETIAFLKERETNNKRETEK